MTRKLTPVQAKAAQNFFEAAQLVKKPFAIRVEQGKGQVVHVMIDERTGGSVVSPQSAWMSSEKILAYVKDHGWLR